MRYGLRLTYSLILWLPQAATDLCRYVLMGLVAYLLIALVTSGHDRPQGTVDSMAVCGTISDCAFQVLHERAAANQNSFFVYRDADSAFNHGFPSGLFGTIDLRRVVLDSHCVDDPASPTGCSSDPARLDVTRGTVFRFNFPALTASDFVGLNWQEPEDFNAQQT